MTRSTARPSCWSIWSSVSSARSRDPRRLSASRSSELAIAVSPPFTATYMSALHGDAARQRQQFGTGGEHDVDAAGKKRTIGGPFGPERLGEPRNGGRGTAV